MDQKSRSARRVFVVAVLSLLVALPLSASAALLPDLGFFGGHQESLARRILNRVTERLCEHQEALGNRVRLVDPAKCEPPPPPPPPVSTLTLQKIVVNDNGGTATQSNFQAKIDGSDVAWNVAQTLPIGPHTASEATLSSYTASTWSGDCAADGTITLAAGESKTCTITNDDQLGHLVVDKVTEPSGSIIEFEILASGTGTIVGGGAGTTTDSTNKHYEVTAGTYSVTETVPEGWMQVSNTCANVVVGIGETKTCTITNAKLPKLTVTKVVVNNNSGTKQIADFPLFVDAVAVVSGAENTYATGTRMVSETSSAGYTATVGGDCAADGSITLAAGDVKSCTITNDDDPPQAEGKLLITEVLYDLTTSTTTPQGVESANEWVEIHNGTNAGINLAGYFIHDASSTDPLPNVILPAGKFAVVTGSSTTSTFWSIPIDAVFIVLLNTTIGNGLSNTGDMVWLENTASTTVDAVSWGTNTTAFGPSVPTVPANSGNSIMRANITTDTDTAADWTDSATPTPGS